MARWAHVLAVFGLLAVSCGNGGTVQDADPGQDVAGELAPDVVSELPPVEVVPDESPAEEIAPVDIEDEDEGSTDLPGEVAKDETPPTVASSDPADEASDVAIPFVVHVTFSEAIRFKETVDPSTFRVIDMNDNELAGELAYDDATFTVTFTPDAGTVFYRASPYQVVLSNLIQDKAGNRMTATVLSFATSPGENLEKFQQLAIQYAPVLYQSVNATAPQFDFPTSYDFDGDWQAANNDQNIMKAQSIPAYVYYDVVESKTHWFVRYVYFYPRHVQADNTFGNEVAGALVVVSKFPSPAPIAVETFFGSGTQDMLSYVTTESGIVTDGAAGDAANGDLNDKDRKWFGVNRVFPQSTLFPGGHYQAYLTKGEHQSCAWAYEDSSFGAPCQLTASQKKTLSIMHFAYIDGVATPLLKGAGGFPTGTVEGDDVGYGLKSILKDWWVRRFRVGDMWDSKFTYEPPEERPGANTVAATTFVNPIDEAIPGGRAPWAWSWNPSGLPDTEFNYYEFNPGTTFYDPAYYFARRHRIQMTTGKTGFSTTYCFNPYLMVDQRGMDTDCSQ